MGDNSEVKRQAGQLSPGSAFPASAWRTRPDGKRGSPKNEYAPLARALGTQPVELGPGLPGRLNPLDAGPLGQNLPRDPGQLAERLFLGR